MPADIQQLIQERPDALRMAREIAKIPSSEERRPLIEAVLSGRLATGDVRAIVREVIRPTVAPIEAVVIPAEPTGRPTPSVSGAPRPTPPPVAEPDRSPVDVSIRTVARVNQRSLDRDVQVVRNILARWRVRMIESDQSQEQVRAALEQILIDAQQLTNALARDSGSDIP
jgi:hypothetical protein